VQPLKADEKWSETYRKTTFLIQATQQGNLDTFQLILKTGRPIFEAGHICLSRKRHNAVTSNVVAAAAYFGHAKLLKFILTKLSSSLTDQVNLPCLESQDIRPLKTGPF
jgi:hypothetical protein